MPYSNDPNWRKFMDAKWRELAQSQKERDNFDVIQRTKFPTSTASIPSRGQAVRAQPKAAPKVPAQRVDYKAARRQALEARQRINLQPKKKIGTRAEPEKFNMVKAGARRRELGAKANATEAELREYKDLSNQIEAELEKKFKADEKKV